MIKLIQETALKILRQSPDVVIRHKLKFEILSQQIIDLEAFSLDASKHVQTLANEQYDDGSWGRFHSQDSRRKQKIPTTEFAVERATHLGLGPTHPVLVRAANFIEHVLDQSLPFPDPPETNNRWETGKRLFLASTLAMIQPDHPLVVQEHALWLSIAERAFQSGQYVQEDEMEAHAELTGASVKDSYLTLNGKYQLILMGSQSGKLSPKLAKSIMSWVWERPDGIRYLGQPLKPPPGIKPEVVDRWLSSLALILLRFPSEYYHTHPAIDWLLSQQTNDGYWDFGPCPRRSTFLPLSENWYNPKHRKFDWTTRVLSILADYHRCHRSTR
jgi:hypothetical protein